MVVHTRPLPRTIAQSKTLGQSAVSHEVPVTGEKVTLVTLERGKTYFYANVKFERNKTLVLEDQDWDDKRKKDLPKVAKELEKLVNIIHDGDGEAFDKPVFTVEYNRPRPPPVDEEAPVRRLIKPLRRLSRDED